MFSFDSSEQMENKLKELKPIEKEKIEYCILDGFKNNKIIFTAPHALTDRIYLKHLGKNAYVGIGDKNTGKLAKLAALYTNTSYIIPKVVRTEVDMARSPEDIGKNLKLLAPIFYSKTEKKTYISIHQNKKLRPILERYYNIIDNFDPKSIIFIHGMHKRHNFDLLLGFGQDFAGIGGKQNAFKFKKELGNKIQEKIKQKFKIGVSNWLFVGKNNYLFKKNITDYNKRHKEKKIGINLEFNLRGRITKDDKNMPTPQYQIAVQILANLVVEWTNNF